MANLDYLDFDIHIDRDENGYNLEIRSPAGQVCETFCLPFSTSEIASMLQHLGRPHQDAENTDSTDMQNPKVFGTKLYEALFAGEAHGCLRSSLDQAKAQNVGLRIRLHLTEAPELADLPWEFLHRPSLNRFLALSTHTPIIRFLELPETMRSLEVTPPLRILTVIPNPSSYPPLDAEREWANLNTSLADLKQRGLVELERLEEPRIAALQRQLRRGTYHILHFIGHGGFDEETGSGVLVMEDDEGCPARISSNDLGVALYDHGSLRLVVLNACEGARSSRTDPFAGAAQSLIQQGIPAVIAMQFPISDQAAITLSQGFYTALADGYPVDGALGEARKELLASGNSEEWGTPVLHMRAPDGNIFKITPVTSQHKRDMCIADMLRTAKQAYEVENWELAINNLRAVELLSPGHPKAAELLFMVEKRQQLTQCYRNGCNAMRAARWSEALAAFRCAESIDPSYRDVAILIRTLTREVNEALGSAARQFVARRTSSETDPLLFQLLKC